MKNLGDKMIKRLLTALILVTTLPTAALAEQLPQPAGADTRVQVFNYSPDDVYVINAKAGYATLIQLEAGEVISDDGGLGIGQADAWNIGVKGNNIFFKPISALPDTNLVLVTNKRTYAFVLTTNTLGDDYLTYIARFNYPADSQPVINKKSMPDDLIQSHTTEQGIPIYIDAKFNKNYVYRGAEELKPTNAWDDNKFTYLKYNHASDLPVVYRVLPDNTEILVNTHIEDDTLVIQEIGHIYRVRLGSEVGEIGNQYNRLPKFNTTGTSDSDWIRIDVEGDGRGI